MRWAAKHKGAAVSAAVIILVLALAVSSFFTKGRVSPVSGAINTLFRPLHALIGSISDSITNASDSLNKYETLLAEVESLRVHVANMEEAYRRAEELEEENNRLRELLGLDLRERGFTFQTATVMQRYPSAWEKTFHLSKGSESGIGVGQCVVSSEGFLVGVISQTGQGWSVVKTVIDTTFSAGVKISRNGMTAVAEGEWSLMNEGRLRMTFLLPGSDIAHGDLILTSGLGGVFPPDLPVGTVVSVHPDLSGQNDVAQLEPSARLDTLTQVFVVLEYYAEE